MATGAALIEIGEAATAAAEALRKGTEVSAATKRLNLADQVAILESLRLAPARMFGPFGVLWRTAQLIVGRRAHYAADDSDDGRHLADALDTVYQQTAHAVEKGSLAWIEVAFEQVLLDLRKLAVDDSRTPKPVRGRNQRLVACAGRAWGQIHRFAEAVPARDGAIGDIETAVACSAEIVLALKLTCHQEVRLVENAYQSAGIERSAANACDMLLRARAALSPAESALYGAAELVAGPAKFEKALLESRR
jgi:hypothetical protein